MNDPLNLLLLIVGLLAIPVAVLLLREFWLWFSGANRRDSLLEKIIDQNRDIIALNEADIGIDPNAENIDIGTIAKNRQPK